MEDKNYYNTEKNLTIQKYTKTIVILIFGTRLFHSAKKTINTKILRAYDMHSQEARVHIMSLTFIPVELQSTNMTPY